MASVQLNQKGKKPEQIRALGDVRDAGLRVTSNSGSVTDTSTSSKRRRSPRLTTASDFVGEGKRPRVEEKSPAAASAGGPSVSSSSRPSVAVNAKGKKPIQADEQKRKAQHTPKGSLKINPKAKKAPAEKKVRPAQMSKMTKQIADLTSLVTSLTASITLLLKHSVQQQINKGKHSTVPRRGVSMTAEVCAAHPNFGWRPVTKQAVTKEQNRRVQPTATPKTDATSAKGPNSRQRRTAKRTAERVALAERFRSTGTVLDQDTPMPVAAAPNVPQKGTSSAKPRPKTSRPPLVSTKGAQVPFDYEKHRRENVASEMVRHISGYETILAMVKDAATKAIEWDDDELSAYKKELKCPPGWSHDQLVIMIRRLRQLGDRFDSHFERAYSAASGKF